MDKFFSGNALKEMIDNKIHELNPLIKHGVSIEELKERISKKEEEKLFFNFKEKIENNINNNKFSIIAEMKKKVLRQEL